MAIGLSGLMNNTVSQDSQNNNGGQGWDGQHDYAKIMSNISNQSKGDDWKRSRLLYDTAASMAQQDLANNLVDDFELEEQIDKHLNELQNNGEDGTFKSTKEIKNDLNIQEPDFLTTVSRGIKGFNKGLGKGLDAVVDTVGGDVIGKALGGDQLSETIKKATNEKTFEAPISLVEDIALAAIPGVGTGLMIGKNIAEQGDNISKGLGALSGNGKDPVSGKSLSTEDGLKSLGMGLLPAALSAIPFGLGKIAKGGAGKSAAKIGQNLGEAAEEGILKEGQSAEKAYAKASQEVDDAVANRGAAADYADDFSNYNTNKIYQDDLNARAKKDALDARKERLEQAGEHYNEALRFGTKPARQLAEDVQRAKKVPDMNSANNNAELVKRAMTEEQGAQKTAINEANKTQQVIEDSADLKTTKVNNRNNLNLKKGESANYISSHDGREIIVTNKGSKTNPNYDYRYADDGTKVQYTTSGRNSVGKKATGQESLPEKMTQDYANKGMQKLKSDNEYIYQNGSHLYSKNPNAPIESVERVVAAKEAEKPTVLQQELVYQTEKTPYLNAGITGPSTADFSSPLPGGPAATDAWGSSLKSLLSKIEKNKKGIEKISGQKAAVNAEQKQAFKDFIKNDFNKNVFGEGAELEDDIAEALWKEYKQTGDLDGLVNSLQRQADLSLTKADKATSKAMKKADKANDVLNTTNKAEQNISNDFGLNNFQTGDPSFNRVFNLSGPADVVNGTKKGINNVKNSWQKKSDPNTYKLENSASTNGLATIEDLNKGVSTDMPKMIQHTRDQFNKAVFDADGNVLPNAQSNLANLLNEDAAVRNTLVNMNQAGEFSADTLNSVFKDLGNKSTQQMENLISDFDNLLGNEKLLNKITEDTYKFQDKAYKGVSTAEGIKEKGMEGIKGVVKDIAPAAIAAGLSTADPNQIAKQLGIGVDAPIMNLVAPMLMMAAGRKGGSKLLSRIANKPGTWLSNTGLGAKGIGSASSGSAYNFLKAGAMADAFSNKNALESSGGDERKVSDAGLLEYLANQSKLIDENLRNPKYNPRNNLMPVNIPKGYEVV